MKGISAGRFSPFLEAFRHPLEAGEGGKRFFKNNRLADNFEIARLHHFTGSAILETARSNSACAAASTSGGGLKKPSRPEHGTGFSNFKVLPEMKNGVSPRLAD